MFLNIIILLTIAEKMFCSPHTLEGYRDLLFEKLNLKLRVGLGLYAVKSGIVKQYKKKVSNFY